MLTVDDYELIRRMHVLEGRSVREIRRRLGHSRNTIAKVLTHPTPPGYRMAGPRAKRVLEPYTPIIDAWLEQDKTAPRKQRHTGLRWLSTSRHRMHPITPMLFVGRIGPLCPWGLNTQGWAISASCFCPSH